MKIKLKQGRLETIENYTVNLGRLWLKEKKKKGEKSALLAWFLLSLKVFMIKRLGKKWKYGDRIINQK